MPIYVVHYDLPQKPDVEYPELIPILTRLGAQRLTPSAWALRGDMSIAALRDDLQICALPGDRFVILQVTDWRTMGTFNRIDEV